MALKYVLVLIQALSLCSSRQAQYLTESIKSKKSESVDRAEHTFAFCYFFCFSLRRSHLRFIFGAGDKSKLARPSPFISI